MGTVGLALLNPYKDIAFCKLIADVNNSLFLIYQ
jgi:hypothetical protein